MSNIFTNIRNPVSYDDFNILNTQVQTLGAEHEGFLDSTDYDILNTEIQNNKANILQNTNDIVDLSGVVNGLDLTNVVQKTGDTMTGDLIIERNTYQPTQLTLVNNRNIQTTSPGELSSSIKFRGDRGPEYSSISEIVDIGMISVNYEFVNPETADGGQNSYKIAFHTYSNQDGGITENMNICRDGVHITTGNLTLGNQFTDNDQQLKRVISAVHSNGAKLALGQYDSTGNVWEQEFVYIGDNSANNAMNFQFRGKGICSFKNNGNMEMADGQIKNVNDATDAKDVINLQTLNARLEPYYFSGYLAFDNGITSGQTYNLFNFNNMIYTNPQGNVTNNKYVIQETGLYNISVNIRFSDANASIYGTINIYNSSDVLEENYVIFEDSNTGNYIHSISQTLYLQQGKKIDITGNSNSNTNVSGANTGTTKPTYFMINRV